MNTATIIRDQIGGKALFMIGAKNLVAHEDGLAFRVGRNAKGVNYVRVSLTAADLYDIEFGAIRGTSYKVKAREEGIYCDMLHESIERNTGMYTSL